MGWTSVRQPRAEVVADLTRRLAHERFEIDGRSYENRLIAHQDNGGTLWLVIEQTIDQAKPDRFICVFVIEGGAYSCQYKDIDEICHP